MSVLRCKEPGWVAVDVPDGRRGLWIRVTPNATELCAGREGDDSYLRLVEGATVTRHMLDQLRDVATTLAWAVECAAEVGARENTR